MSPLKPSSSTIAGLNIIIYVKSLKEGLKANLKHVEILKEESNKSLKESQKSRNN